MKERIEEQVSQDDTIADILESAYWMGYNDAAMRYGEDNSIGRARDMEEDVLSVVVEAAKMPEVVEVVRDRIKSIAADPHIKDRYDMYAHEVIESMLQAIVIVTDYEG